MESTTVVPPDGLGGGDVTDGRGAVPIEVVFFGGGGGGGGGRGGAVPSEVVVLGGEGDLGAVPIKVVCFGGGGGVAVSWQPPMQLVTTMVEVVRVV